MIDLRARRELDAADRRELEHFIDEVVDEDTEPGFVDPFLADRAPAVVAPTEAGIHVLAYVSDRFRPGHVVSSPAAYLNILRCGGDATVRGFATLPKLRSRGIATMITERLRANPDLLDAGVVRFLGTAHGDHPAAERLARRSGAKVISRSFVLVRPGGVLGDGRGAPDPAWRVEALHPTVARDLLRDSESWSTDFPGGTAPVDAADSIVLVALTPGGALAGVLRSAADSRPSGTRAATPHSHEVRVAPGIPLDEVSEALLRAFVPVEPTTVGITVPAEDEALLRLCRRLGFHHRLTDVSYESAPDSSGVPR